MSGGTIRPETPPPHPGHPPLVVKYSDPDGTIVYLLNCADTRLLCGLNLTGLPYILHTSFSRHGSSGTASSWNISSSLCTIGVYTGSRLLNCDDG